MRYQIDLCKPLPGWVSYEVKPSEDGEGLSFQEVIEFFAHNHENYEAYIKDEKPDIERIISIKDSNDENETDSAQMGIVYLEDVDNEYVLKHGERHPLNNLNSK